MTNACPLSSAIKADCLPTSSIQKNKVKNGHTRCFRNIKGEEYIGALPCLGFLFGLTTIK